MASTDPKDVRQTEDEVMEALDRERERQARRLEAEELSLLQDGFVLVRDLPEDYRVGRAHIPAFPSSEVKPYRKGEVA